jgi:peroxiredoxin
LWARAQAVTIIQVGLNVEAHDKSSEDLMKHPLRLTAALAALALSLGGGPADVRADKAKHKALIGKPAPDIQADFAVTGKPVRLADLKGKVVVLTFWGPWSPSSRHAAMQLQEWFHEFNGKGLEVLAVTRYCSDEGRQLTFDDDTGTVKALPPKEAKGASRETDKQLLRDFAAYHKLEFPLMVLPKNEAARLYDLYGVSGMPQFVLIDRGGRVRMVRVGDSGKAFKVVGEEIQKLLYEKK